MGNRIVIVGAGGHGKVVCDAILAAKKYSVIGFIDDSLPVGTAVNNDCKVIGDRKMISSLKEQADVFIVAIGNNMIRKEVFDSFRTFLSPAFIVHPSAVIGSEVKIGDGSVVLANAVINASSTVGENTIVNSRVVIDHDCKVGSHIHLSIGTMVGSTSEIADGYLSAIGENINSFSKIG
jgi:acetyltransferase EpsM